MEYQRYKIEIKRTVQGDWRVAGYWEIPDNPSKQWDLDGEIKFFKTRKEALEFCMNASGVPE